MISIFNSIRPLTTPRHTHSLIYTSVCAVIAHRADASHQPLPGLEEPAQAEVNEGEAPVVVGSAQQQIFRLVVATDGRVREVERKGEKRHL